MADVGYRCRCRGDTKPWALDQQFSAVGGIGSFPCVALEQQAACKLWVEDLCVDSTWDDASVQIFQVWCVTVHKSCIRSVFEAYRCRVVFDVFGVSLMAGRGAFDVFLCGFDVVSVCFRGVFEVFSKCFRGPRKHLENISKSHGACLR